MHHHHHHQYVNKIVQWQWQWQWQANSIWLYFSSSTSFSLLRFGLWFTNCVCVIVFVCVCRRSPLSVSLRFTSMHCHLQLTNAIHTPLYKCLHTCMEESMAPKCQFPERHPPPTFPFHFRLSRSLCKCHPNTNGLATDFHSPLGKQFVTTHSNIFVHFPFRLSDCVRKGMSVSLHLLGSFSSVQLEETERERDHICFFSLQANGHQKRIDIERMHNNKTHPVECVCVCLSVHAHELA